MTDQDLQDMDKTCKTWTRQGSNQVKGRPFLQIRADFSPAILSVPDLTTPPELGQHQTPIVRYTVTFAESSPTSLEGFTTSTTRQTPLRCQLQRRWMTIDLHRTLHHSVE